MTAVEMQRHLDGDEGVGRHEDADERQDGGKDGLDQEEGGGALQVVDGATPLGHHLRHVREVVVGQDDLGDVPCGGRARGHGDRAVRLPEGEDVVDAVARHGHCAAPAVERLHEVALLLGGHAPEDAVAVNGVLDGRLVLKRRRVHVGTGAGHARPLGDGRDRAGVVSGDDAQLDALLAEVLHGCGGRRPDLVADGHAAQKLGLALDGALPREAGDAAADHDALHLVEDAAGVGHGRPLGTEDEGGGADGVALPLRRDAAGVLPGRAEGDRARVALRGHGAPGLGGPEKGAGGVVGVLRVGTGHAGKGPRRPRPRPWAAAQATPETSI